MQLITQYIFSIIKVKDQFPPWLRRLDFAGGAVATITSLISGIGLVDWIGGKHGGFGIDSYAGPLMTAGSIVSMVVIGSVVSMTGAAVIGGAVVLGALKLGYMIYNAIIDRVIKKNEARFAKDIEGITNENKKLGVEISDLKQQIDEKKSQLTKISVEKRKEMNIERKTEVEDTRNSSEYKTSDIKGRTKMIGDIYAKYREIGDNINNDENDNINIEVEELGKTKVEKENKVNANNAKIFRLKRYGHKKDTHKEN